MEMASIAIPRDFAETLVLVDLPGMGHMLTTISQATATHVFGRVRLRRPWLQRPPYPGAMELLMKAVITLGVGGLGVPVPY